MRFSSLLHAVPEEQSHRGLNLLWQKVKSSGQVICILPMSALCSVLSQKSSCLAYTGWFKCIVAHSEKLYKVTCPLCTPLSVVLSSTQRFPAGLLSLERQNTAFQMYPGKESHLSQCDPEDLLTVACVIPTHCALSHSFPLPDFASQKGFPPL